MAEIVPIKKKPVSVVNKVTEYGALFNSLNEKRIAAGLEPLVSCSWASCFDNGYGGTY